MTTLVLIINSTAQCYSSKPPTWRYLILVGQLLSRYKGHLIFQSSLLFQMGAPSIRTWDEVSMEQITKGKLQKRPEGHGWEGVKRVHTDTATLSLPYSRRAPRCPWDRETGLHNTTLVGSRPWHPRRELGGMEPRIPCRPHEDPTRISAILVAAAAAAGQWVGKPLTQDQDKLAGSQQGSQHQEVTNSHSQTQYLSLLFLKISNRSGD